MCYSTFLLFFFQKKKDVKELFTNHKINPGTPGWNYTTPLALYLKTIEG